MNLLHGIRIGIHALLSMIIGIMLLLSYDTTVKELIAHRLLDQLRLTYECQFTADSIDINPLTLTLSFQNLCVQDAVNFMWQWRSTQGKISGSWRSLLLNNVLDIELMLDDCKATTQWNESMPDIWKHIQKLATIKEPALPLRVHSINIMHGALELNRNNTQLVLSFKSVSRAKGDQFCTNIFVKDGSLTARDDLLLNQCKGACSIVNFLQDARFKVHTDLQCCVVDNEGQPYDTLLLSGICESEHARFSLSNIENTVLIDPIIVSFGTENVLNIQGFLPTNIGARLLGLPLWNRFKGICTMRFQGDMFNNEAWHGYVALEDFGFDRYVQQGTLKTIMQSKHGVTQSDYSFQLPCIGSFTGNCVYHQHDSSIKGTVESNSMNMITPYATINAHNVQLAYQGCWKDIFQGTIKGSVETDDSAQAKDVDVRVLCNQEQLGVRGAYDDKNIWMIVDKAYSLYIKRLEYSCDSQQLFLIESDQKNKYSGCFDIDLLRQWLKSASNYEIQAEGTVDFVADCDDSIVHTHMNMHDGNIRLGSSYNFLNNMSVYFDWDVKKSNVHIKQADFQLHNGHMQCCNGVINDGGAAFVLPIIFNNCAYNVDNNFFGVFSGYTVLNKRQHEDLHVTTRCIVQRGICRDLFFEEMAKPSHYSVLGPQSGQNIVCDVVVTTRDPIKMNTSFVQGNGHLNLSITGDVAHPIMNGYASLSKGILKFPYKDLFIKEAKIGWSASSSCFDPMINLVAHNRIKHFDVQLGVYGTLQDHAIQLHSNPYLPQEQIVGLLVVGSAQESLNIMMPALIMTQLHQMFKGALSSDYISNVARLYKVPFTVNLVPVFTDQSGRGGLRAVLEITVSDRWRALIQKNFNLTEDTHFEVEYQVTDDITMRAIRDERSDIGGEIEWRWKF